MLGAVALAGACTRASVPPPQRATADDVDLHRLAAEMDDRSVAPIWPMVPEDLKALVASRIPASLSPAERRRLGENWVDTPNVTESCDGGAPQEAFLSFAAGWSLLEDLAWSPTSEQRVAAAAALYDRLRTEPFTSPFRQSMKRGFKSLRSAFQQQFREHPEQRRAIDEAFCLGPVRELIARRAIGLQRHFAAEILRGAGSDMTPRVLRDEAARRVAVRDYRGAMPFATAAARLVPTSSDAWIAVAKLSYQTDDVGGGDDALTRALALGADRASDPVRSATRFQTLAHEAPPKTFEQALSRFWALFEMERMSEARALVDVLRRQRPNDARAFLGDVWLNYNVRAGAAESFVELAHAGLLAFNEAPSLTGQDEDFYRVYLALAFQEVFGAFADAFAGKVRIGSAPAFVAAISRARILSGQLAAHVPDAAALTSLSLDMLEAAAPREGQTIDGRRALAPFFPRAQALYAAHPSAETYRFVLGLAMLTDDRDGALAAVTAPLRFDLAGDERLALWRAEALVSIAVRAKDWNVLKSVSTLLAAVPRSSTETEHDLDLLRADTYLVRAVHGEKELWRSAYSEYTHTSWSVPFFEQDRASNNVVAIADAFRPDGDTSADWSRLRAVAHPPWPVLVNAAAQVFRAGHRGEAVVILKSRSPGPADERPDFVTDWLACLEGTPADPARPPTAADQNAAMEIVYDGSKPSDGREAPFTWQLSSALNVPPAKPTLQFSVGDASPWLIASPRSCWASRRSPSRPAWGE